MLVSSMLVDPKTLRRLVRVREQLIANDSVSIGELAAQVGLSSSRLIRVFAALYGTTPHQLRTQTRLDRARRLLAHGDDVTSVSMDVGFSSLGSFSALFTRWTGTPPSRYRKLFRVPAPVNAASLVPGCLGMLGCLPRNFREARPR
jgi:AraC-like DNA-binding protein